MSDQVLIKKGITLHLNRVYSPLATWEWKKDIDTLCASEAFFSLFHIKTDKRFLSIEEQTNFFNISDLKLIVQAIDDAYINHKPFELIIGVKTGESQFTCQVNGFPVLDTNNKIFSINGIVKNITQQEDEKTELRTIEAYYHEFFESGNEGIIILDPITYQILDANNTSTQLTHYSLEELKNFHFNDLYSANSETSHDKLNLFLKKAIIDDTPQVFECALLSATGSKEWFEVYAKYFELDNKARILLTLRIINQRILQRQSDQRAERVQNILVNLTRLKAHTLDDVLNYILGEILKYTRSTFGYLKYFASDKHEETLCITNLKDRFEALNSVEKQTLELLETSRTWADILLIRKPLLDNHFDVYNYIDAASSGHDTSPLKYLSIPIISNNRIVASIGILNTKRDYTQNDIDDLSYFMDSVWDIVETKEYRTPLQTDDNIYRLAIDQSPLIIEQYDASGLQIAANTAYERLWGFPSSTTIRSFNLHKSIELRNSGLYKYIQQGLSGESVIVPDYQSASSTNGQQKSWFSTRIYPVFDKEKSVKGITITHEDISDRKGEELLLKANLASVVQYNALIQNIIDKINVKIFWKDKNGIYLGCNQAFVIDVGLHSPADIVGKTDEELPWAIEFQKLRSQDLLCLEQNHPIHNQENKISTSDGTDTYLLSTVLPFRTSKDTEQIILGFYEDITKFRQTEQKIKQHQDAEKDKGFQLSKLITIDSLEDIYAYITKALEYELKDFYSVFTSLNQSETKLTIKGISGISDHEYAQLKRITNFNIYGKNLNVYPSNYGIYKTGKIVEFKGGLDLYLGIQLPASDARKIERQLDINHIYTIGINQGEKLLSVIHLFSSRKLSSEEKQKLESIAQQSAFVLERRTLNEKETHNLDSIYKSIETASDAIIIAEAHTGIIAAANEKSELLFNREISNIVGFHYSTLIPKPYREDFSKVFASSLKAGEPIGGEFWIDKKGHDHMPVILGSTIINCNNKLYVMVIFHDNFDRNKSNALLEQKNKELEQLIGTKDKLFSIISHDLKNPLTGIVGFAEVVKDELSEEKDEQLIKFMDIIIRSADSMVYLINNLLQWSRIQQGKISPKPSKVDLFDIVEREFELLYTAANNKNINLINNITYNTLITSDKEMISTVIRNLVSNAIKFTPKLGSVAVDCKKDDDLVEVQISDTGMGMPQEMANKIFKLDNNTQRKGTSGEKGTGLGLIICKDFVEQNKGTIWVESEIDKGTTFFFTVPAFKE